MAFITAITGGSGAGKTTIAQKLAARLGDQCTLLSEDDYYRCSTTIVDFNAATYDFDRLEAKDHELLAQHLEDASRGLVFEKPLYDFVTHTRLAETERVEPKDALILEGLHVFATPRLRAAIDLAVFVEADELLRLARRFVRDVELRGRSARSVYRQFFQTVRPAHAASVAPQKVHADVVLVSTFEGDLAEANAHAQRIMEEIRNRSSAA